MGNQGIGRPQDGLAGPVVLLKLHHLEGGIVVGKVAQILRARAAPGVDGLVIVAHHRKSATLAHEGPQQLVLGAVGVLILVHQEIAHPRLPGGAPGAIAVQQARRQND